MENNMNQFNPNAPQGGAGLSIASMVLGIVAVLFNCCFYYIALPCGIIGLVLGIISLKKANPGRGMAIAGVILSAISLLLFVILLIAGAAILANMPWSDITSELNLY